MRSPRNARPPKALSAALIQSARAGSAEALAQVFELCRPYLLVVAHEELDEALRAKFGASDLVQDTWIKVRSEFPGFAGCSEAELLGWLRQILRNHLNDLRERYRGTQKRQVSREVSLDHDRLAGSVHVADPAATPQTHAAGNEEQQALERALGRLPERYARVVQLRYLENRTFVEIATELGCSAEAARKLWGRALRQLRGEMEREP